MSSVIQQGGSTTGKIPREKGLDQTLALLREGYEFISNRCELFQSDIFETRLMGEKVICMSGEEAARIFYNPRLFQRKGAAPKRVQKRCLEKVQSKRWTALPMSIESSCLCR